MAFVNYNVQHYCGSRRLYLHVAAVYPKRYNIAIETTTLMARNLHADTAHKSKLSADCLVHRSGT